jgi:hypothetical protein
MKLLIHDITGDNAMTREAGEALYNKIYPLLLEEQPVELDFSGVRRYLTVFFNFAIAQLYRDIDTDKLSQLLTVSGLNLVGEKVLARVLDNAKRYYTDEQYRDRVDTVILEQAANL